MNDLGLANAIKHFIHKVTNAYKPPSTIDV